MIFQKNIIIFFRTIMNEMEYSFFLFIATGEYFMK